MRPHWWQPNRLLCPWDSPGKNTGVGCHFPSPSSLIYRMNICILLRFPRWLVKSLRSPGLGYTALLVPALSSPLVKMTFKIVHSTLTPPPCTVCAHVHTQTHTHQFRTSKSRVTNSHEDKFLSLCLLPTSTQGRKETRLKAQAKSELFWTPTVQRHLRRRDGEPKGTNSDGKRLTFASEQRPTGVQSFIVFLMPLPHVIEKILGAQAKGQSTHTE